jgi:hypothetical protein
MPPQWIKRSALLWVAGSFVVSGCTVIVPPPHPPHPPNGPAAQVGNGAAAGAPVVKPGAGLGVWIWRTDDGKWHVRSTTKGKLHKFRGLIEGANSPITWYEPGQMEFGDIMARHGQGLVFKFETAGHVDDFQFVPDDRGCVRFHVTVDERPQPNRIFLGSSGVHPPSDHFLACP